jgi:transposase
MVGPHSGGMAFAIALSDEQWELVADVFDPPGRRGAPSVIPRRQMVDAMLFIGRTACQWRYLPERYGAWTAVWAQWRRWRANGVWARAMTRLVEVVRCFHDREPLPSMVMVDAQTVKGARYGPTFHQAGGRGGRTIGTKRTLLVEILGLPVAVAACSARPHDVVAGRELLGERIDGLPRLRAVVGDRAYRGLAALAERKHLALDIKAPQAGVSAFTPLWPLYKVEHAIAQLGRWRRLSRCYEGTEASARAWLEVASVGYLAWRATV